MKLVIDRSKWARAYINGPSLLKQRERAKGGNAGAHQGAQCCVGIFLSACGVPDDALEGVGVAENVHHPLPKEARWLTTTHGVGYGKRSDVAQALYTANDDAKISEETRELIIKETFKKQGVEVEFVGPKHEAE